MEDFRSFFEQNYQGTVSFIEKIIKPVFGDLFISSNEDILQSNPNCILAAERANIISINRFGSFELEVPMQFFDITLNSHVNLSQSRVNIQALLRQLMETYSAALIVFHYSDNPGEWRVSYVSKGSSTSDCSSAKRYTYMMGANQKCRTAAERFALLATKKKTEVNITEAFSVEVLTKQFYNELFNWYQWALSDNNGFAVTFPNDTSTEDDDRKIDEHIIRLITRLMFVWFIKQKKLVPENIFKTDVLKKILNEFDPTSKISGNYYNAILQNLFFATLNKPINERKFTTEKTFQGKNEHYGIKTLFRDAKEGSWFKESKNDVIQLFKKVPFLNGGLFECLDKESNGKIFYYDGFSRLNGRQKRTFLPNCLFFDPEKGLISILEKYNFTIEENTPTDIEVALDPELLGKVFENLLGAYNPETKETARKQSGSFYTPREIVNYMVDESLMAYLNNAYPDIEKSIIRQLFTLEKLPDKLLKSPENCKRLTDALKAAKILDPACGSGAFPMGMLSRMLETLRKLEPESNNNEYDLKLHLIENCIYGIDIQTIAVQITKLRFFISLVCEQSPTDNINDNYGVKSLPNLEAKFVSANTLISLNPKSKEKLDLEDEVLIEMKNQLWDVRCHKNFSADTWQKKMRLREEDKDLCKRIEEYLFDNAIKPDVEKIECYETQLIILQKELNFCVEEWVDDTEAQKVQLSIFAEERPIQPSIFRKDKNKTRRDEIEETIKRLNKDIEAENKKATLTGLEAEVHKMIIWDLYDQNSSSPFFDAEWMFGLQNGFDIIIGNPPYISIQRMKNEEKLDLKDANYKSFENTGDIYALFYERGNQLLKPNGILTYITSRQWIQTSYGKSLRKYFATETNPLQLIDFGQNRIFEGATVFVNILMLQKNNFNNQLEVCSISTGFDVSKENLADYFSSNKQIIDKLNDSNWSISSSNKINEQIESLGIPLSKRKDIEFYAGIKTGLNEAFHIDENTKNNLIRLNSINSTVIKPLLRGKDIKRYGYDYANLYTLFIPWHFPLQNDNTITNSSYKAEIEFQKQFPDIFNHLFQFKDELSNRNQVETGIRYEWYALQRFGAGFYENYEKPKIVWIEISDRANYAYDDKGMYLTNSAYFLTCKNNNVSLKYLLAVLNSKVADFYFCQKTARIAGGRMRYTKQYVEQIPIPEISLERQKPFISLVDKILFLKDASKEDSSINKIIYFFEHVVDLAVYELYFKEDVHKAGFEVQKYVIDSESILLNFKDIENLYLKWNNVYHPIRNAVTTLKNYEPFKTIEDKLNRKAE